MRPNFIFTLSFISGGITAPAQPEHGLIQRGLPEFPIPYIGESLKDYTEKFLAFFSDIFLGNEHSLKLIAELSPSLSIDFNCNFLKAVSKTDDMPNFNTDFDHVEGLDSGKVKWLVEADGRTEDDPVILYSHGGGFVLPLSPNMLSFWQDAWKEFNVKSDRLSILVLDYAVAPKQGTTPKPLQQIAAVYNVLTKSSKNIILAGDSAGGHLSLSLMRHVKYPVNSVQNVTVKPQGFIGLSPAVNVYPNQGHGVKNGTYESKDKTDVLSADSISAMGEISNPDETSRNSTAENPWKDYVDWYDLLPENKSKVFISYGDNEVLKGDIMTWMDIANLPGSEATIYRDLAGCDNCLMQSGTHDNIIFNLKQSPIYKSLVGFLTGNLA